jgi:SAM-dependent methyltransferase
LGNRIGSQQLTSKDLWGQALLDYYHGIRDIPLILHTSYGPPERVPLNVFFRNQLELSNLEAYALELCEDDIIDIGAGTGCHSLILQELGYNPCALEISPGACEIMKARGLNNVCPGDIFNYHGPKFKTALLMMNGLGIAGHLNQLGKLLKVISLIIGQNGQILADSSDISYLYDNQSLPDSNYYGELSYTYEYLGERDTTFPWLFVSIDQLKQEALKVGLETQIVFAEDDQYLVRMTRS